MTNVECSGSSHRITSLDVSGCDLSFMSTSSDRDGGDGNCNSCSSNFLNLLDRYCSDDNIESKEYVESLDASRCQLGPRGVCNFLSLLSSTSSTSPSSSDKSPFPKLKQLFLQRNAVGSTGGRAVGTFLSRNNTITELDISLNDIKAGGGEPTASQVISNGLRVNTTLTSLTMEKCALGPEGATHLASALCENQTLKYLELAGNMIGPIGGKDLFDALKSNSTLEYLGLRMNRIGGCSDKSDVQMLANALAGGSCCIARLDLSYNDLRCEGCAILSRALVHQCTLKELKLEKNDILEFGSVALANALCTNDTLETLVLKGNTIGGATAIGNMLQHNKSLILLDMSSCSIGNEGGSAIGHGLAQNNTLEQLFLNKNSLGSGGNDVSFFAVGIATNKTLKALHMSGNDLAAANHEKRWGKSIANALSNNSSLQRVDLSRNALSYPLILDAVAAHSSMERFDFEDNNLENISIETQLMLAERMDTIELNLLINPLSSPPLGRLAGHFNLKSYLTLLANEKTAVTRIRLMVLGFGGVGKSTFCRAVTTDHSETDFQSTLSPVQEWGVERLADWASRLGTPWSSDAVELVVAEKVTGKDLIKLIDTSSEEDNGSFPPSALLLNLCSSKYPSVDALAFARAISALIAKGYLSTVGAVKVDGTVQLGNRTCSLVDFAGQVEFLVSHQLLLSSVHTLNMIIQPAPSFGRPNHRHFGSFNYWSQFLNALGDRRRGSLILAVSQLDKMLEDGMDDVRNSDDSGSYIENEFATIKQRASGAITCDAPLQLDYSPNKMLHTLSCIKATLTKSLDEVAKSWWVPASYEALANIIQRLALQKQSEHDLPILTRQELVQEIQSSSDELSLLTKMQSDEQLLSRAINYLEAVGDVMQVGHDWLLIDPIEWFSGFLSHFIKDDLAVSSIQVDSTSLRRQRGTVNLDDVIHALKHEYKEPEQHVSQIMELLCSLELCVPLKASEQHNAATSSSTPGSTSYLFPCLLPPLQSQSELANSCWSQNETDISTNITAVRGHRFCEVTGFIPPGLFVAILARLHQHLQSGIMHPLRMWKDHAILIVNKSTRVQLRCDLDNAVIDVVGCASENEQLFVGAAKGQASIVIWLVHIIKQYLKSYRQLKFEESWLCPNPKCHGLDSADGCKVSSSAEYKGSEFLLDTKPRRDPHDCNIEGCYRFLGSGHSSEAMKLCSRGVCQHCNKEPVFRLRDNILWQ